MTPSSGVYRKQPMKLIEVLCSRKTLEKLKEDTIKASTSTTGSFKKSEGLAKETSHDGSRINHGLNRMLLNDNQRLWKNIKALVVMHPTSRCLMGDSDEISSPGVDSSISSGVEYLSDGGPVRDQSDADLENSENQKRIKGMERDGAAGDDVPAVLLEKRWQYSDLLQLCIRSNCARLWGLPFYNCVYDKCVNYIT